MMEQFDVSERRICRVLNQPRSTQRYLSKIRDDEELLIKRMVELATKYGRYGYRRITALLQREGGTGKGCGINGRIAARARKGNSPTVRRGV